MKLRTCFDCGATAISVCVACGHFTCHAHTQSLTLDGDFCFDCPVVKLPKRAGSKTILSTNYPLMDQVKKKRKQKAGA